MHHGYNFLSDDSDKFLSTIFANLLKLKSILKEREKQPNYFAIVILFSFSFGVCKTNGL